jgi:plastocyanin domain-containing protein
MKNSYIIGIILLIVLIFGIFMLSGSGNVKLNENILASKGQVQVVKLSVEGGKYIMNPSEIEKGVTVRIEADMTKMPGCSKSFVIPSFNVMKSFTTEDNAVEFIADKAGTFNVMCSMNMYKGTFTVLDNDGSKATYVEASSLSESAGGTCGGAASGGCGCGS